MTGESAQIDLMCKTLLNQRQELHNQNQTIFRLKSDLDGVNEAHLKTQQELESMTQSFIERGNRIEELTNAGQESIQLIIKLAQALKALGVSESEIQAMLYA